MIVYQKRNHQDPVKKKKKSAKNFIFLKNKKIKVTIELLGFLKYKM